MKKRLLFVNDEMVMGGVARILINTLQRLDYTRYAVDVLILHPHGDLLAELPPQVRVIHGGAAFYGVDVVLADALKRGALIEVWRKLVLLARMKFSNLQPFIEQQRSLLQLDRYDIEVAAKEGFCSVVVAYGNAQRKINWIHVDYARSNYSKHHMPLMRKVLQHFDAHIAVSDQAKDAYQELFQVQHVHSIPNVMDVEGIAHKLTQARSQVLRSDKLQLIVVGRLHPQKAIHRALEAMVDAPAHVELNIVGEGPLRAQLEGLCDRLKLRDRVNFLGQVSNPLPLIQQADLFCLPSLYEGYPTTVIEAFMAGVPVLACDVAGVAQQIQHNQIGWIVDNSDEAFKAQLLELVQQPERLAQAKQHLKHYRYDNPRYLEAFCEVLEGHV